MLEPSAVDGVVMGYAGHSIPASRGLAGPLRSKRLVGLANDDRLVEQIRRGSEAAFEVAYERHSPAMLGFCRHMLGSLHEAEDAVQQTFAAAYHDLERHPDREIKLKPWLFAIARNRCLSILRARRELPTDRTEVPTAGLDEHVEARAELRQLLADVGDLPHEQRAALLLSEVGDLSHTEVAAVLGCGIPRVKALVFRARSGLIQRRNARDTPCEEIQEQLANLRGGSLRRNGLRLHLRGCPACSAYRRQVAQQRRMLAAALPVAPSLGLKSSVLAAVGIGGSAAGGGLGATSLASAFGASTLAKLAVVGVLAGGGGAVGTAVVERGDGSAAPTGGVPSPARAGGSESPRTPLPAEVVAPKSTAAGPPARPDGAPRGVPRGPSSKVVPPPKPAGDGAARGHDRHKAEQPGQSGTRRPQPPGRVEPKKPVQPGSNHGGGPGNPKQAPAPKSPPAAPPKAVKSAPPKAPPAARPRPGAAPRAVPKPAR